MRKRNDVSLDDQRTVVQLNKEFVITDHDVIDIETRCPEKRFALKGCYQAQNLHTPNLLADSSHVSIAS
jgi:hypothetical protein